ncbi:sterol-binding protein [Shewanella sp. OPT22]|nr:sterol-binding protein [Shewanella sp. OPT22]
MQQKMALLCSSVIEASLAQLNKLNPHLQDELQVLDNKVIEIHLNQLPWPLFFICNDEVLVLTQYEAQPDVSLKTDLSTLAKIRQGESLTDLIKADKLAIDGDINILQQFSAYLEKLDFNLIEPISKYIGDVPAHFLQSGFNQFTSKLRSISKGTTTHLTELAVEEYQLAPHRIEYIQHCDQLEDLTADVTRLEKRIASLRDKNSV